MVIIEIRRTEWNESLQCEFEDIVPALVWDPTELHHFLVCAFEDASENETLLEIEDKE